MSKSTDSLAKGKEFPFINKESHVRKRNVNNNFIKKNDIPPHFFILFLYIFIHFFSVLSRKKMSVSDRFSRVYNMSNFVRI